MVPPRSRSCTNLIRQCGAQNMGLVGKVKAMAAAKGVTAGQLALAWVHAQGDDVFPIPGAWSRHRTVLHAARAQQSTNVLLLLAPTSFGKHVACPSRAAMPGF